MFSCGLCLVQELNHLHAAAVFMTVLMIVAFLSSIAIVRRILMATSVLKASYVIFMGLEKKGIGHPKFYEK